MTPVLVFVILVLFEKVIGSSIDNESGSKHLINFDIKSSVNNNGRRIISINDHDNTYGPAITVRAGDTINLRVQNHICSAEEVELSGSDPLWRDYCGTALHFHGLVPIGNENDGVPGLVQAPIKSGESYWYNFTVPETACGTFWYHSHSTVQYGDGLRGMMIVECPQYTQLANQILGTSQIDAIEAPAPLPVDFSEVGDFSNVVEEQLIAVSDWYTKFDLNVLHDEVMAYDGTTDPRIDDSLINGSEKENIEITLRESTEALILRIVNSGLSGTQIIHLKNHKMIIMETDGVLIKPYVVETLSLAVGQRVTVVVHLNEDVKRGEAALRMVNGCNKMMGYITKTVWFVKQNGVNVQKDDEAASIRNLPGLTKLELYHELEPLESTGLWDDTNIQRVELEYQYDSDGTTKSKYGTGMYKVNGKTFDEYFTDPIVLDGAQVTELIINAKDHMRHPWHLHGQQFQVVSLGDGREGSLSVNELSSKAGRKYTQDLQLWRDSNRTPMTRDSINIPGNSYAALRIKAEFQGKWLLHCHVDWHIAKGLGVVLEIRPRDAAESAQISTQQQEAPIQRPHRFRVLMIYLLIMIAINCGLYRLLM